MTTPTPTLTEYTLSLDGVDPMTLVGVNDRHLKKLDQEFPQTKINVRGDRIKIAGPHFEAEIVQTVLKGLIDVASRNHLISSDDIDTLVALASGEQKAKQPQSEPSQTGDGLSILYTHNGEEIKAKTPGQRDIVHSSAKNDVLFVIGPAGTGKTYTSVALAVKALKERKVKKIVLARPAVEAGENLGFLPGDLKEKIDPYLRPLYDALEDMIDSDRLELNLAKNVIEIAPLAYMRGRTLNNAFVILDEAQNATNTQMKMFLTRIGFNSRAIITGDITQTDLPKKQESGLISIPRILNGIEGIDFVYLKEQDVVRHKLVRDIIKAYERFEDASSA